MKFKNDDDSRYFVNFMIATEYDRVYYWRTVLDKIE